MYSCMPPQAMVACGFNGLGLALVIPCLQSLTADFHPPEARGRAFGWMFCVSSIGRASTSLPLQEVPEHWRIYVASYWHNAFESTDVCWRQPLCCKHCGATLQEA